MICATRLKACHVSGSRGITMCVGGRDCLLAWSSAWQSMGVSASGEIRRVVEIALETRSIGEFPPGLFLKPALHFGILPSPRDGGVCPRPGSPLALRAFAVSACPPHFGIVPRPRPGGGAGNTRVKCTTAPGPRPGGVAALATPRETLSSGGPGPRAAQPRGSGCGGE
jgi:hypothetical protein